MLHPSLLLLHLWAAMAWKGGMFLASFYLRTAAAEVLEPPRRQPLWVCSLPDFRSRPEAATRSVPALRRRKRPVTAAVDTARLGSQGAKHAYPCPAPPGRSDLAGRILTDHRLNIVSDDHVQYETQDTGVLYRDRRSGHPFKSEGKTRWVLTTRQDGTLDFMASDRGGMFVF
jgi:hypothetical protein